MCRLCLLKGSPNFQILKAFKLKPHFYVQYCLESAAVFGVVSLLQKGFNHREILKEGGGGV